MKQFTPIRKEDAIKEIAECFKTHKWENIGIVFKRQRDATAFLDKVKTLLDKGDSKVWNKKQINSKNLVKVLTDNTRNRTKILSGYICEKLFIEAECLEKYRDDILKCCVCPQSVLNPDEVENFEII